MKRNVHLSALWLPVVLLSMVSSACQGEAKAHADYGKDSVDTAALESISAILEKPDSYAGKTVTVKGIIASVCPSSGCFLRLGEGKSQIFVDLGESGFNVPPGKGIGNLAYAKGVVQVSGDEVKIAGTAIRIMEK